MWLPSSASKVNSPIAIAAKLSGVYFALSLTWLFISDWLVYEVLPVQDTPLAQTLKGMGYIAGTTILLAMLVYRWTRHVAEADRKYEETLVSTVQALSTALEKDDEYTADHSTDVAHLSRLIAAKLGYSEDRQRTVELAALVHDIGKIAIPNDVLSKPGRLTEEEFDCIRRHPSTGYEILRVVTFNAPIPEIVRQHHERRDGSGYPFGLTADKILEEAQIVAVADVFVSMAHDRPYRRALGFDAALAELKAGRGSRYHPGAVDICEQVVWSPAYGKVDAIAQESSDGSPSDIPALAPAQ